MSDAPHATPADGSRREDRPETVDEIAHELNNVLGGILMAVEYAISQVDAGARADTSEEILTGVKADAERCCDIVRRLQRLAGGHGEAG
jgi:signal transduction histidine kinase